MGHAVPVNRLDPDVLVEAHLGSLASLRQHRGDRPLDLSRDPNSLRGLQDILQRVRSISRETVDQAQDLGILIQADVDQAAVDLEEKTILAEMDDGPLKQRLLATLDQRQVIRGRASPAMDRLSRAYILSKELAELSRVVSGAVSDRQRELGDRRFPQLGIPSRYTLMSRLAYDLDEVVQSKRMVNSVAFASLDANGLKAANDFTRGGHEAGNLYLSKIADVCMHGIATRKLRDEGVTVLLASNGSGDEFFLRFATEDAQQEIPAGRLEQWRDEVSRELWAAKDTEAYAAELAVTEAGAKRIFPPNGHDHAADVRAFTGFVIPPTVSMGFAPLADGLTYVRQTDRAPRSLLNNDLYRSGIFDTIEDLMACAEERMSIHKAQQKQDWNDNVGRDPMVDKLKIVLSRTPAQRLVQKMLDINAAVREEIEALIGREVHLADGPFTITREIADLFLAPIDAGQERIQASVSA